MKTVYDGGNFFIVLDENGNYYFEDNNSVCLLKHGIKHPKNIIWNEYKGWIYKNGKNLPWAE